MALVQDAPTAASAAVMNAVGAHAEATGAIVLAEGIEHPGHLLTAQTLGATLGQGWHFGRPGPLPAQTSGHDAKTTRLVVPDRTVGRSPVEIGASRVALRPGRKDILLAVTRRLEAHARQLGEEAVVVSTFQHAGFFTRANHARYAELARSAALVAALGEDLAQEPAPGVRGAALAPEDPVRGEWDVAVVGPHFAAALVARDLNDTGPDHQRRFEFALTFDRELVVEVVQSLMARIVAEVVP